MTIGIVRASVCVGVLALSACGPVSPELAARQCEERANAALGPTGEVGIGINNKGKVGGGIEIGVTSDYLRGADPYQVYESCVRQKTGEGPVRPLIIQPGLFR